MYTQDFCERFRVPLIPRGLSGDWLVFESTHDLLFARDVNIIAQIGALMLMAVQMSLLYQMSLNNPDECGKATDKYVWKMGIPLCCLFAGATAAGDLLSTLRSFEYVEEYHRGDKSLGGKIAYSMRLSVALLVELMNLCQLYAIASVMAGSTDLVSLVSDFIGVAVVCQCDELVASVLRIPCPDPDFYQVRM